MTATTPRRLTRSEALRQALTTPTQDAMPATEHEPGRAVLERLADHLAELHTTATMDGRLTCGTSVLHTLNDAAALARAAAEHGWPRPEAARVAEVARQSPASRLTDPATSKAAGAYKMREPSHGNHLGRLLIAFLEWDEQDAGPGVDGLTAEEAAVRAGLPLTSEFAKRCSELRDGGYIEHMTDAHGVEITRPGASGRARLTWELTTAGGEAARRIRAEQQADGTS